MLQLVRALLIAGRRSYLCLFRTRIYTNLELRQWRCLPFMCSWSAIVQPSVGEQDFRGHFKRDKIPDRFGVMEHLLSTRCETRFVLISCPPLPPPSP